jgi:hypothetical protein
LQPVTGIGNERQGTGARPSLPPSKCRSDTSLWCLYQTIRAKVCCKRSARHLAHTLVHTHLQRATFIYQHPQIKKKRVVTGACRHLNRLYVCMHVLCISSGRQCRPRHLTGRLCLVSSCLLLSPPVSSLLLLLLLLLPVRRAAGGPARTSEDHRKRRGWNRLVGCWC